MIKSLPLREFIRLALGIIAGATLSLAMTQCDLIRSDPSVMGVYCRDLDGTWLYLVNWTDLKITAECFLPGEVDDPEPKK